MSKHHYPFMMNRRHMLKSLAMLGLAGATGLGGMTAKALGATPVSSSWNTMTETRLMMGTFVSISLASSSREDMRQGLDLAFARIGDLEHIFNRHDTATPVGQLNARGRLDDAPEELLYLIKRSLMLGKLTGQAFDITVQPVIDLFKRYQNPQGAMAIPRDELRNVRALVGTDGLSISGRTISLARQGMGLTFDGIAKGHIADEASKLLTGLGLANHLVNAGGDIVAKGKKSEDKYWMSAISDPLSPSRHERPFALSDAALATSGSYRTFFDASREHHHLINPAAGVSPVDVISVSVLGKSAQEADALATALSVMPPRTALELTESLPGRECLLITAQGRSLASSGWPTA